MPQTDVEFEAFTPGHLDGALRLSRQAGWPHLRGDWDLVRSLSRGVVAVSSGLVIATAFATPFRPVGLVNLIIVDEGRRGSGLGRAVMNRAMATIAPQEWRLVATADGLPLYRKLGFEPVGEILQHQGVVPAAPMPVGVRWAGAADLATIIRIDAEATGLDRAPLLRQLAVHGRFAVIEAGDTIAGYAALRAFGRGEVAGPVIARDLPDAQRLLEFFFAQRAGRFLRVDTSADSGLAAFLPAHGLAHVSGGIAMRRGALPRPNSPFRNFALAAQALG